MRTPPTATLAAALPEQWVIIAEPSRLAVACRAAREVVELWLRTQPRLTAALCGCFSSGQSVREWRVPDWI